MANRSVVALVIIGVLVFSSCLGTTNRATRETDEPMNDSSGKLPGFDISPHWGEQVKDLRFEPGVRIHVNAPNVKQFTRSRPTEIVFYALPNGNSIEWTIGRKKQEGLDWHYFIQHIGAQTRRLREVVRDRNIVVVYLEADGKSWPSWRSKHENKSEIIALLVDFVTREIDVSNSTLVLSSHSGGGSFVFGYINAFESIPDEVKRICFLDSNYGFSVDDGHGSKLLEWLGRSKDNYLSVLAYDDREITYQGKKVVGPTGGTYRATHRMVECFRKEIELPEEITGDLVRYRGLNGRMDIIVHTNPENRILHTVLVGDMNGFIHSMTVGGPYENKAGVFAGQLAYEGWIQPH